MAACPGKTEEEEQEKEGENPWERRYLILGKMGTGKSSTGNSLLSFPNSESRNDDVLSAHASATRADETIREIREWQPDRALQKRFQRRGFYGVEVCDTPGLYDTWEPPVCRRVLPTDLGSHVVLPNPTDDWVTFIRATYPDLLKRTYFYPPLFFFRVPHSVTTIANQVAKVRENAPTMTKPVSSREQRIAKRAARNSIQQGPNSSPTGEAFIETPPDLPKKGLHLVDSDLKYDEAVDKCLAALQGIGEAMMVLSKFNFQRYLRPQNEPLPEELSDIPSVENPNLRVGACDIMILHSLYGVLLCDVKSVGGESFAKASPANQRKIIAKKLQTSVQQLNDQEGVVRHLVNDMASGKIRVRKAVLLPNISTATLTAAGTSPQLQKDLCRCTRSKDIQEAISKCMCSEQIHHVRSWWDALWTKGPDPRMDDALYEGLVARFCGPGNEIEINTPGPQRKVLRSLGQAVAETSQRFSTLVLTPLHVDLLRKQPEPKYCYLQGPPGCGKTVTLELKGLQWLKRGMKVVVVGEPANAAVTILVQQQMCRMEGAEAAEGRKRIHRHLCHLDDIEADVRRLVQLLGPEPDPRALVVFDEVPQIRYHFIKWLTAVCDSLPTVTVWCAGVYRWDNDDIDPPPEWMLVVTLSEPLRCPPAVSGMVARSREIDGVVIPRYTDSDVPFPTAGLPVTRMLHRGQEDHQGEHPYQCVRCADRIGEILTTELKVGQQGHPFLKDAWILCHTLPDAESAEVLVERLCQHYLIPTRAVSQPPSEDDARELALGLTDQVLVTDYRNVLGLERSVVVVLEGFELGIDFISLSRCTGYLFLIE